MGEPRKVFQPGGGGMTAADKLSRTEALVRREAPLGKEELARLLRIKEEIDPTDIYIGQSPAILRVFEKIHEYNKAHDDIEKQRAKGGVTMPPAPILLLGDTGVGKSTVAESIHKHSCRYDMPYHREQTALNRLGDPTILLGKWAGFGKDSGIQGILPKGQDGLLLTYSGGTVFVDEIDGASREFQSLLLDVLDSKEISVTAGEGKPTRANVRLILATNRDLDKCNKEGSFRHDLLARIRNYEIVIPPLSERREDAFLFLERICEGMKPEPGFLLFLLRYTWPGNVRQLIHVLQKAKSAASSDNRLTLDRLEIKEPGLTLPSATEILAEIGGMTDEDCRGNAYQEAAKIFRQQVMGRTLKAARSMVAWLSSLGTTDRG